MTKQTPKFRASHTILSTWASGNWEMAIKYYFKLEQFVTPAMVDGRNLHQDWEKEIISTGKLPAVFSNKQLIKPQAEIKKVVELADWLDLVGIIDCYDKPTIYEFKSGKKSSEAYASSSQAGVYGVLANMAGLLAEKAEIYHYDQYKKASDMSIVYLTDKLLKDSLNWIETLSGEMHNYFLQNDLYVKYGGNLEKGNDLSLVRS